MCLASIYISVIASIVLGFIICQIVKMIDFSMSFGHKLFSMRETIIRHEAINLGVRDWYLEQYNTAIELGLSDGQDYYNYIIDILGAKSKRVILWNCVYCMGIRASLYVAIIASLTIAIILLCPLYLLMIILIPVFTYTFIDAL